MVENSGARIGVLALQGSFREHITSLKKAGADAFEVRKKEQLDCCDGLIIPGGESTTMALVAERWGLLEPLRAFAKSDRPIWGTCAGLIFLAEEAEGQKEGGQQLLGGLHCKVSRNFFGSQVDSFECELPVDKCLGGIDSQSGEAATTRAMFIRAPAILSAKDSVKVLAEYTTTDEQKAATGRDKVIVAVREGKLMATAFHPELTDDLRWHKYFADMCVEASALRPNVEPASSPCLSGLVVLPDIPVYAPNSDLR
ncbi:hypothetical protein CYMTET_40741 [Cymbomonas tetramitiformis]|uniref:glutaminase n=1 Tax=Cymbomonas tetramitiformis TaxID=36881 RepID=A0AAE0F384_9CHLO|nr:hypothetical protein CYMTET_40741 [Cymbomonas tetramitiformis]